MVRRLWRVRRIALAGQEGLEPPTTGFGDRDSGQLSYCPGLPNTASANTHRYPAGTLPQRQDRCRSMQCTSEPPVRRTAWCPPGVPRESRRGARGPRGQRDGTARLAETARLAGTRGTAGSGASGPPGGYGGMGPPVPGGRGGGRPPPAGGGGGGRPPRVRGGRGGFAPPG